MRLEGAGVKIMLCLPPTDMRKSFDTLAALVQTHLQHDPFCGHWFVLRIPQREPQHHEKEKS
jgi:transposase